MRACVYFIPYTFIFSYPEVHPIVGMIVSGICVSSGLLMLSGNSKLKYGAVSFAGVMAYFAFYPYLKTPSGIGSVSGQIDDKSNAILSLFIPRHFKSAEYYVIPSVQKFAFKCPSVCFHSPTGAFLTNFFLTWYMR